MGKLSELPFWAVESCERSDDVDGGNAFAGSLYTVKNGSNTSWMMNLLYRKGEDGN